MSRTGLRQSCGGASPRALQDPSMLIGTGKPCEKILKLTGQPVPVALALSSLILLFVS